MKKLILILFLLPTVANAQTISFSPTSISFWGQIPNTIKASVEYKDIELVAVHPTKTMYDYHGTPNPFPEIGTGEDIFERPGVYSGYYFGLFYTPLEYKWNGFTADGGAGIWNRKFPTKNGQRVYFTVQVSYQISDRIGISWEHYSNGFGIKNPLNPGLDSISLEVSL